MVNTKTIHRLFSFIIFLWSFSSCKDKCRVDEFSFKRENFNSNLFKLSGYYLGADLNSQGDTGYHYKIFYRNGVCINLGTTNIQKLEQSFADGSFANSRQYNENSWGIYSVIGDTVIKIEYWFPKYTCGYRVLNSSWKISNDSTFVLLSGNNVVKDLESLHFKPFSPRPDRTNNFIP